MVNVQIWDREIGYVVYVDDKQLHHDLFPNLESVEAHLKELGVGRKDTVILKDLDSNLLTYRWKS